MNLLKVFTKIKRSDQPRKHIQDIIDPITPLDLKAYNQHNKGGRPKALTDAHVIQIMRWKAENVSNREIGRRLHVSEMTVRRYIKSYTYKAKPPISNTPNQLTAETIND